MSGENDDLQNVATTEIEPAPPPEPQSNEPAKSVREIMREAVAKQGEGVRPSGRRDDRQAAQQRAPATGETRDRDGQGRFTPQPAVAKVADPQATGQQPADGQQTAIAAQQPNAPRPPASWSPELKAEFSKLAPNVQAAIDRRDREIEHGFAQQAEFKRRYAGLEQFNQYMDAQNITHSEVMKRALEWEQGTLRDPIGTALHLLQIRGVDPRAMMAALANPNAPRPQQPLPRQQQPQPPPVNIEQEFNRLYEQRNLTDQVDKFFTDPAYPHAETLAPMMSAMIEKGFARDLPSAYQMAIRAHPELSQVVAAQQRQPAAQNGAAKARAADQARSASKAIVGAPARGTPLNGQHEPPKSVRDAVRLAFTEHSGAI